MYLYYLTFPEQFYLLYLTQIKRIYFIITINHYDRLSKYPPLVTILF